MRGNRSFAIVVLIILLASTALATGFCVVKALSAYQNWEMIMTSSSGSHEGALLVQEDGSFTSWGFSGSTSTSSGI